MSNSWVSFHTAARSRIDCHFGGSCANGSDRTAPKAISNTEYSLLRAGDGAARATIRPHHTNAAPERRVVIALNVVKTQSHLHDLIGVRSRCIVLNGFYAAREWPQLTDPFRLSGGILNDRRTQILGRGHLW